MGDIYIKEPYSVEDITTRGRESGVDHISKIVSLLLASGSWNRQITWNSADILYYAVP